MAPLAGYLNQRVLVVTTEGRVLLGKLVSCDQLTNLVLAETRERVIHSPDDREPSFEREHGLYLVRGETVAVCGLVDEDLDGKIDWAKVRGQEIHGTKHV